MLSFVVLCLMFMVVAMRQRMRAAIQIWQIFAAGAVVMIVTGSISPGSALRSIDWQVIVFLAGMFVVGEALRHSGLLAAIAHKLFYPIRSPRLMLLAFMLSTGLGSALVTNDTIAVIGTGIGVLLAQHFGIRHRVILLALAFSITIGSVFSPLGNPQNLLIALDPAVRNPFVDFFSYLFVPSIICLLIACGLLCLVFRKDFHISSEIGTPRPVPDRPHTHGPTVRLCGISIGLLTFLIGVRILITIFHWDVPLPLWAISVIAALPILIFSRNRIPLLRGMDWKTLVFFATLFVCVQAVWEGGVLQVIIANTGARPDNIPTLILICLSISQLISNVPLVALFLPLLQEVGADPGHYMVLAAASTLAGNMTVLGAASNVIIIQQAQKDLGKTSGFSFGDMAKTGIPLTLICVGIYSLWWLIM